MRLLFRPVLGAVVTILSGVQLYLARREKRTVWLTLAAILCFVLAAFITFRLHFPLNAQIMAWSVQAPPDQWMDVRAQWWQAHMLRTGAILCGYVLLLLDHQVVKQA